MTFLNVFMLLGAAAAAIPLLIHLFHRQRVNTLDFSSIIFIKQLHLHQSRALKVRQLLLLLLRALIILLAVFAFARPALEGPLAAWLGTGVHQRTAFVIVLDNSYSMSAGGRDASPFANARASAGKILNSMQNGDEGIIVLTAEPVKSVPERPTSSLDLLKNQLANIEVSSRTGNMADALSLANGFLANITSLNKNIYILSDLQQRDWQALRDTTASMSIDPSVALFLQSFEAPEISNVSIDDVAINERLLMRNQPQQVTAVFTNHSALTIKDLPVNLFINGVKRDSRLISAGSGKSGTVRFSVVINTPGRYSGYVEVDQDDILADNRQFFSMTIPSVITAQVTAAPESRYFLEQVLKPAGTLRTPIEVKHASIRVLDDDQADPPDVMIIDGSMSLSSVQIANLKRYLNGGGGLLMFLGSGIDRQAYDKDLIADVFHATPGGRLGAPGQRQSYLSLGQVDYEHPVFNVFQGSGKSLPDAPRFYAAYNLKITDQSRVIAGFTDGAPAVLEGSVGRGTALLIASDINTAWSDLALKSMFVPLMHRSIKYLYEPETIASRGYYAGMPVERFIKWQTSAMPLNIVYPSGTMESIKPIIESRGASVIISQTGDPGVYRIQDEEDVLSEFTINPNTEESNLTFMSLGETMAMFKDNPPRLIPSNDLAEVDLDSALFQAQQGYEIWKLLIGLVLLLVILESWLTRSGTTGSKNESVTAA